MDDFIKRPEGEPREEPHWGGGRGRAASGAWVCGVVTALGVERTFGWLSGARRLARDYERTAASHRGWVWVRMIELRGRRLVQRGRRKT